MYVSCEHISVVMWLLYLVCHMHVTWSHVCAVCRVHVSACMVCVMCETLLSSPAEQNPGPAVSTSARLCSGRHHDEQFSLPFRLLEFLAFQTHTVSVTHIFKSHLERPAWHIPRPGDSLWNPGLSPAAPGPSPLPALPHTGHAR